MINRDGFYVTPERSRVVCQEIAENSEPGIRFYLMVIVSTMIAGFGLTMNSTAVVIGAMLVAPLMTPIFGMALALIRGDAHLLGRATRAEIAGVVAAILMGFVLGNIYPSLETTPEMLARTRPQLFDLLVAVFSGFAGAYALVDEKISPALPGVAIATAIVPPLANTGLCFSVGAYVGGIGSFLLFFSNFLSILLVASAVFWFFGMVGKYHGLSRRVLIKRFGLPIVGFLLIALFLTHTLIKINEERDLEKNIEHVLLDSLGELPSFSFDKMIYRVEEGVVHVFAQAYSDKAISPTEIEVIQEKLTEKLGRPARLTIRCKQAHTVTGRSTYSQVTRINLNGNFIDKEPNPRVLKTKIADSTIRNFLVNQPTATLLRTRVFELKGKTFVVATVSGVFSPDSALIQRVEFLLRDKLKNPNLELVVRFLKPDLYDQGGLLRFELTGFVDPTPEQEAIVEQTRAIIDKWFESDSEVFLVGMDYTLIDGSFYFYLETSGAKLFPVNGVHELERLIMEKTGQRSHLHVMSRIAAVVTSDGHEPYNTFSRKVYKKLESKLKEDIKEIMK
ncbi:MAG: TIGR00341 family protein [Desulfobacterales bacterium]|nr:TIGR00341 family protein [Desulfobacterales bacterium]